ncbi:MAG: GGDEF domain-containing protein [Halorhodospira sp.]
MSKLELLQDMAELGFWELNLTTGQLKLDSGLRRIYGFSAKGGDPGFSFEAWRNTSLHPEDRPWAIQQLWRAIELNTPWRLRFRIIRTDAQVRYVRSEGRIHRTPNGHAHYLVGFEEDITHRVALEQELEHQAQRDGLTGTYNRRKMDDLLHQERERALRYHHALTTMLIDVDGFKAINDSHGHEAGDEVLHDLVSRCFRPLLRASDHLGRWGGDEFLVILPETHEDAAYPVAERIRDQVAALQPGPGALTVSIGVAAYHPDESIREWLRKADLALYDAKRNGRNQVMRVPVIR